MMATDVVVDQHSERIESRLRECLLRGIKDLRESLDEAELRAKNEKDPRAAIRRVLFSVGSGHSSAMTAIQTALSYAEDLETARAYVSPVPVEPTA